MGNGVFKKISSQDRAITPFKVYKSWAYSSTGSLSTDGIDRLMAIKADPKNFTGATVTLDTAQTSLDSGSFLINLANDKEASIIWYSLNHLYYKRAGIPYDTFGYTDHNKIQRDLYKEASVISIPQKKFGESIKPGSVRLQLKNSQLNSTVMSLYDDGMGNLIDSELSSSISGQRLYLGFNSTIYTDNYYGSTLTTENTEGINYLVAKTNVPDTEITSKNVWITPSYNLPSASLSRQWGNSARLYDDSYIRIPNRDEWNFKLGDDYAVSFWYYKESANAGTILSKRTTGIGNYLQSGVIKTGDINYNSSQYPFNIYMSGSAVTASISNGSSTVNLTYSAGTDVRRHLLLQKSGSAFQLYIDGGLVDSKAIFTDGNIYNNADIFIGSLGLNATGSATSGFRGAIDEFFIFEKCLTQNEINQLANPEMAINTNRVGNIFYEHGLIVLSDPRPKYGNSNYKMFNDVLYDYRTDTIQPSYLEQFYLEYNSTVTLYEHEYIIKIKADEFNFTTNATIRKENDVNSAIPKDFVFNSNFSPYITTIGLYSPKGELLAIGKLGTPIKKRDDVDLNFIVRFDV